MLAITAIRPIITNVRASGHNEVIESALSATPREMMIKCVPGNPKEVSWLAKDDSSSGKSKPVRKKLGMNKVSKITEVAVRWLGVKWATTRQKPIVAKR